MVNKMVTATSLNIEDTKVQHLNKTSSLLEETIKTHISLFKLVDYKWHSRYCTE